MSYTFPSEIKAMPEEKRIEAFQKALKNGDYQDSLSIRIRCGIPLTQDESISLFELLSKRCKDNTKHELVRSIVCIPNIRDYGIFTRVLFVNGSAMYCAGQSYPDEIRTVRKCLL